MKIIKVIIVVNIFLVLISCGTIKEGFSNQKKNNSDEFLVEKKQPLVMPPNYEELPEPGMKQKSSIKKNNPIFNITPKPQNPAQMKNTRFTKIIPMYGVFIHGISIG